MKKLKQFIARNQEGLFYGGLIGLIVSIIHERIPFIDKLLLSNAQLGNTFILIFIGMSIGMLIDAIWKPKK